MNLWMLCEHGEAKRHYVPKKRDWKPGDPLTYCPGGHPVEGGEKVWWCPIHKSIGTELRCDGWDLVSMFHPPESPCQMVVRSLM